MEAVHVKDLEKFCPGYRDRNSIWCKIEFTLINANPAFELLPEVDKWRLIHLILLEIQLKNPVPLAPEYLERKGWDLKDRAISMTLQMLHGFVECVTPHQKTCNMFDEGALRGFSHEDEDIDEDEDEEGAGDEDEKPAKLTARQAQAWLDFRNALATALNDNPTRWTRRDISTFRGIFFFHYQKANGQWATRQAALMRLAATAATKKNPRRYFTTAARNLDMANRV